LLLSARGAERLLSGSIIMPGVLRASDFSSQRRMPPCCGTAQKQSGAQSRAPLAVKWN
jgi:hypothetical protein